MIPYPWLLLHALLFPIPPRVMFLLHPRPGDTWSRRVDKDQDWVDVVEWKRRKRRGR